MHIHRGCERCADCVFLWVGCLVQRDLGSAPERPGRGTLDDHSSLYGTMYNFGNMSAGDTLVLYMDVKSTELH